MPHTRVLILGAGAWGTALGVAAASAGSDVWIWGRNPIAPDLPKGLQYTPYLSKALETTSWVILAIPAQTIRDVLGHIQKLPPSLHPQAYLLASKGMEQRTGYLLSEVVHGSFPEAEVAALGGPNIAREILEKQRAGATLACTNPTWLSTMAAGFQDGVLMLELSEDILGVQVLGALKNVLAIGYGMLQTLGVGENQRATFLVRGLQEMGQFAQAISKGASSVQTLLTYAGMGDLILTCTSTVSRNARFGREYQMPSLNISPPPTGKDRGYLAEGVFTASAVMHRSTQLGVSLPLFQGLSDVLNEKTTPQQWKNSIF